jgi:hypothetical protein
LATIAQGDVQRIANWPVYVAVCDYHGSLGTLLSDYGFAPITDRAKMVRPVMQWVRGLSLEPSVILKRTAPVIGAPFILPTPPETPLPRSRVLMHDSAMGNDAMRSRARGFPVRRVGVHPAAQADFR